MTTQLETDYSTVRNHRVRGGAGVEIHVTETGNEEARPVLFIHGVSQCGLSWRRQLHSDLRQNLRLVTMDLRGHGQSAKPDEGYEKSVLWAEDVHAVITALRLDRPILCGWSYGGIVVGDYLRTYGEQALGGVALVAASSRLGEAAIPFLGRGFLATLPGLFSTDVSECTATLEDFLRLNTAGEPEPEDFYLAVGYNAMVPPGVRQAMMTRDINHDDLLARLALPTLIVHGLEDQIVLPVMSHHHVGLVPHAKVSFYPGVGHCPFSESTQRFNEEMLAFASAL